ncbi:acyl-CoA dehydrogenase family protein [Myxococcus sp. RHSTA-1-4]|uniref:acyl-CoA dehydrogenase family protein n=1 Tax=Myxococcus sp. RHSTA-1-4 TaxID=2874601 RepID=UPI001CC09833|nr:acyl-CoA dehydrogenase family protein [Myxococcus sp. RHSTA-1-4]MBZ4420481.1 acyl-CoA dehydrogenase family protein [Myxococcus sp. RHSTA-1-4]
MTTRKSVLEAVRALVPFIQAKGPETEAARTLPADVLAQLRTAGVFRMSVPRELGGEEVDLLTAMEVLETISRADGSIGWTAMLASEAPHLFALLETSVFRDIYGKGPDVVLAGAFSAQGEARIVPGGYRITGRWSFATGSQHCHWMMANCVLLQDGKPMPGPIPGLPASRAMLFPAQQGRVLDNWHVLGLRGTGSHDFTAEDLFVPQEYTLDIFTGAPKWPGPLYVTPVPQFALHMGAVAVGIAQGAIDDLVAYARAGKKRLYASSTMAESQLFRHKLGRAEATLRAVRAMVRTEAELLWTTATKAPEAAPALMPRIMSTLTWVAETAAQVVDTCYMAMGGNAARDSAPMQRRFRDIHTFAQHGAAADSWYVESGGVLLGKPDGGA